MGEGLGLELALAVEGAQSLEYLPELVPNLECAGRALQRSDHGARAVIAYQFYSPTKAAPPEVRGVLAVTRDGATEHFEVRAARPRPLRR
jgi:hypothetical protein